MMASAISGSGSSSPNPSIITTALSVLETIRSRSRCSPAPRRSGTRDELALDAAQPDRAHGPEKRHPRQQEGRRGADHRRHVGIVLAVSRNRARLDLHLVAIPIGKERPNRPVDQPGGEDFLGGRPPLALDEAARELPRGIRLLAVIDTQLSGKKSSPSRPGAATRATSVIVSPMRTTTEPLACLAR